MTYHCDFSGLIAKLVSQFLKSGNVLKSLIFGAQKLFSQAWLCVRYHESCIPNPPLGSSLLFHVLGRRTPQESTFSGGGRVSERGVSPSVFCCFLSFCFSGCIFIYIKGLCSAFSPRFPPLLC